MNDLTPLPRPRDSSDLHQPPPNFEGGAEIGLFWSKNGIALRARAFFRGSLGFLNRLRKAVGAALCGGN
jgi:hypothetical protein